MFIHRLGNNVYDRQITSNRTASTTIGWKSSLGKILHRDSPGESRNSSRAEKTTTTRNREAERKSLTQRRQRRQHSDRKNVQKQRKNTTITLQMKTMKRGNTDCRRFRSDEEIRQRLKLSLQSEKLSSSMQR